MSWHWLEEVIASYCRRGCRWVWREGMLVCRRCGWRAENEIGGEE